MTETTAPPRPVPARPTPKPGILDIAPYVGGKAQAEGFAEPLKLSSNENVLGCSEKAQSAYLEAASRLNLYPDGRSNDLRAEVAAHFKLEPERLVFGCGSDEVFTLLAQAYCEPGDNVVQGEHGFLAYRIAAGGAGAEVRFVEEKDLRLDIEATLAAVDERTRLVFVANPANPTGTWNSAEEIRRLHEGLPERVILVLDGAYAEFADDPGYDDGIDLARHADNVVVTRTFSKVYGLAGLRVGWGYTPTAVADTLDRIRAPFNVNVPAQAAAVAALRDQDFVERSVELAIEGRAFFAQQLGGLGLETAPSQANFVLVKFPAEPGRTAAEAEAHLARDGVLVRGVAAYGLADHLRITVGRPDDNRRVVDSLARLLGR